MGFGQYRYKDELRKALAFHNMPVTLALFLGALLSTPFLSIPPQHSVFACSIFVTRCAKKRIPEVHAIEVFPSPAFLQTFVPLLEQLSNMPFSETCKNFRPIQISQVTYPSCLDSGPSCPRD